ncbi:enhancer of split M1 protein [Drosophila elegans]|uniref:enhancer of split M1 protein n=1 Tax=Drosophila elegans TaxID=30023 RepID=UPI0007E82FF0|nr:enhancer of split M1 protein [Drosophila elegans]
MKIYINVLLGLILVGFGWGQNCNRPCGPCILPTCNYDGKCYYEGTSACGLENEKCRRRMNSLPPFIRSDAGFCEDGVNLCN